MTSPVPEVCGVAATGVVRCPIRSVKSLKPELAAWPDSAAAAGVKLADEQAVLAMVAVLRAAESAGWRGKSFSDWGVIAAPRFLGRCRGALALSRFHTQGPRSVSPLIIPYLSLHSVAGCVSLGLHAHGPNFGVGGGPGHLSEGLLAAVDTLRACRLPGIWVVATGWDPEPIPSDAGDPETDSTGYAVAIALVAADSPESLGTLRVTFDAASGNSVGDPALRELADSLEHPAARAWTCPIPGGQIAVQVTPAARSIRSAA